jgi:hypothetical protein
MSLMVLRGVQRMGPWLPLSSPWNKRVLVESVMYLVHVEVDAGAGCGATCPSETITIDCSGNGHRGRTLYCYSSIPGERVMNFFSIARRRCELVIVRHWCVFLLLYVGMGFMLVMHVPAIKRNLH